jgi:hypothetical protein
MTNYATQKWEKVHKTIVAVTTCAAMERPIRETDILFKVLEKKLRCYPKEIEL